MKFGGLAEILVQISALLFGVGSVLLLLIALGHSGPGLLQALWDGSVGSSYAIQVSIGNAIPLILIGGAVWLAFTTGLFNLGAEGQLQWGGLAAVFVAVQFSNFPPVIIVLVSILAAMAAGAIWAGVAAWIKTERGAHEVISTIMLNFIAVLLVNYLINGPLRDPEADFPVTLPIPLNSELSVYIALIPSMAITLAAIIVVQRTRIGLSLRSVGLNREAARFAGIPIKQIWLLTFISSGMMVGLAGGLEVMSVQYLVSPGWSLRWGTLGIAIAFLATKRPMMIIPWGIVFGMLQATGPALKADEGVQDAIVTVMLVMPLIFYFAMKVGGHSLNLRRQKGTSLRWPIDLNAGEKKP
jgi:ABC-type uncharacterized transport system permease subunit